MKTTMRISSIGLALLLVGCAGQKHSQQQPLATFQSFTNQYASPRSEQSVTVYVHTPNEPFVYVAEEVKLPGRIVWTNGLTLANAINLAGGFGDFASKSRVTLRRTSGTAEQYSFVHFPLALTNNPVLRPADLVYVPARHLVWQWP
jgi:protein involved in polysaccharide export with SLBB domain